MVALKVLAFNREEKERVDAIFLERKSAQSMLEEVQEKISQLKQLAEHKVNQLSPEDRAEYTELQRQDNHLGNSIENGKQELAHLNSRLEECHEKLRSDRHRETYKSLAERLSGIDEEKARLQNEVAILRLDPEAAKQRLKEQAEESSDRMKDVQGRVQLEKQALSQARRKLQDMEDDLNARNEFNQEDEGN